MQPNTENKMGTMPIAKLLAGMALPMMLSMMVLALYNIVDSVFVSRVSENALTAVSLAYPAQNLMIGVATGVAVGVNALLSRALGAGDRPLANRVGENGVFLALCGYAIFLIFGAFGVRAFMRAQTSVEEIIEYGTQYLTIVCCCSFGMFGQTMFERLMQSTGRTVYTMVTQMTGAVINIIFDPIFIFTFGLKVRGAAIATVMGQIIAFALAYFLNRTKNPDVRLKLRGFRPDIKLIGRILAIGVPSVIMVAIGSVMTFLMNIILINYTAAKETAAAVFGVYFKLNSLIFMPIFGMNNAVTPIVAFNYGAQNRKRMLRAVKLGMLAALCIMTVGTLIFELAPQVLLGLFDASETMLAVGIPALRITATTFIVASLCIVLGSVFQACGIGTYSMYVSFTRQLVVLIPAAFLLARLGQSVGNDNLVWLAYPIAEVVSLCATLLLFRRLYNNLIVKIPEGSDVL